MTLQRSFIQRLMQIESHALPDEQGRWTEDAYQNEMLTEDAEVFFWPSPESFSAFVLYRVLPFNEVWVMNWACEEKGKGIGSQVFLAFLRFCTDQGFQKMGLEVREHNLAAVKIYEKGGLKMVGRRERYYTNGEAALVFMGNLGS